MMVIMGMPMMMVVVGVVMRMVMMVTVSMMMVVIVRVGGRRRGGDIGAPLGIERRLDLDHAGAKSTHHVLDHVVATDAQTLGHELRRQVPVAEMPGDAHHVHRIGAADFHQWLRCRDDLDQPPVFQHQRVAAPQSCHLRQIEQKLQPAGSGHRQPPPMAIVEFEDDRIGGLVAPRGCGLDGCGAKHRLSA